MLVYANNFTLIGNKVPIHEDSYVVGSTSSTAAFRSVVGWLRRKTGLHFTIPDILSSGEFHQGIYQVRTYAADKREPKLYSILLTHRDEEIFGRFWSTEISVRLEGEKTFISVFLETEEISTQVKGDVTATRPALINYLAKNAEFSAGTIGLNYRKLGNSEDDYKALLAEIERKDRDYPLVLVSCDKDGFFVDPENLQQQLFGLARVVYTDENSNSWAMEKICGKFYSTWSGAVNIISSPQPHKASCYSKLLLRETLEGLQADGRNLLYEILSLVTSSTNWAKRRQHFSPADVRAKRQKDYLLYLREQANENGDYKKLFELACDDIEKQKIEHDELLEQADKEREEAVSKVNKLRYKTAPTSADEQQTLSAGNITAILGFYGKQKGNSPEQCLEFAEQVLGDKIIVLDNAKKTAREAVDYQNPHIILEALWKLGDKFLPAYLKNGDVKNIFGTGIYAAKESEQTMNSPKCKKQRTFTHEGEDIVMWKHLGWGVADNTRESLRLYFEIKDDKIIIGHCGAHLDTITTNRV